MLHRGKFFAVLILALTLLSGCGPSASQLRLLNRPAPPARYTLMDGGYHGLPELRGKTVILAFWDAGCPRCKQTMPKVNELARALLDRPDIVFLAVSVNALKDEEKLREVIDTLSLDAVQHVFSGNDVLDETFRSFEGEDVPYLVLIDRNRIVRWLGRDAGELKKNLIKVMR